MADVGESTAGLYFAVLAKGTTPPSVQKGNAFFNDVNIKNKLHWIIFCANKNCMFVWNCGTGALFFYNGNPHEHSGDLTRTDWVVQYVSRGVWSTASPGARESWLAQMITLPILWNKICEVLSGDEDWRQTQQCKATGAKGTDSQGLEFLVTSKTLTVGIFMRSGVTETLWSPSMSVNVRVIQWSIRMNGLRMAICTPGAAASQLLYWSRDRRKHHSDRVHFDGKC